MVWPVFKTATETPSAAPVGSIPTRSRHLSPASAACSPLDLVALAGGLARRCRRAGFAPPSPAPDRRSPRPPIPCRTPLDSLALRTSPMNAFWRSFLLPGWGQAKLGPEADRRASSSPGRASTLGMSLKTRHELALPPAHQLRPRRGQAPGARGLAGAAGLQPSVRRARGLRLRPPAPTFPRDLRLQAVPGGVGASVSDPLPRSDERRARSASSIPASAASRSRAPSTSACPHESTIYFGDTARVPYGPKSPETVRRYSLEILDWLLGQGVKAVVIACNTSTAHALERCRQQSPVPVHRRDRARRARRGGRGARHGPIGVIGTAGTIASNAYARAIQPARARRRGSSSRPARSSCRWWRRAGSSTRPPS